jgi:hypothetical protein
MNKIKNIIEEKEMLLRKWKLEEENEKRIIKLKLNDKRR